MAINTAGLPPEPGTVEDLGLGVNAATRESYDPPENDQELGDAEEPEDDFDPDEVFENDESDNGEEDD